MKKLATVLGLALLMAGPSWASSVGVGVAHWDTEDAAEDEGLGLKLAFDVNERVDLEFRISLFDNFAQVANGSLNRLEVTPLDFGFSYHFPMAGRVEPFVGAGGTFLFNHSVFAGGKIPQAGGPKVDDEFGFYFVAGAEVELNKIFGAFGEVLYRQAKLNVTFDGFHDLDFRSDFTGPAATAGLMLHW